MPSVDSMIHHVFYSLYSGRRVTHKWAMKYPKLVTRVTLYGKVDVQFLKRGVALPVTLRQAIRAEAFQLEQCGATAVPLTTHYFNRRTKKKVTSRSYRRDPDSVDMYIYPIAYGEPTTALEAGMAQARWGIEVHQMRMKLAMGNFVSAVRTDLAKAGFRDGVMITKPRPTDLDRLLKFARPAEEPKSGIEEMLKHAKK